MLKVDNINALYGRLQALWDVSIEVKNGELVALLGSNGSGKTTLLELIVGLRPPVLMSGSIVFLGKQIVDLPPHRLIKLGISLVPEGRRVLSRLSVYENLLMGAQTKEDWEARKDTLEMVENLFPILKERRDQQAGTLSGGERQMLVIGRGLMHRPKLMMLDEPSLGLAPILVRKIFEAIAKIHEDGVTVVLAEQHVREALKLCNRGYVLEEGRVALEGQGKELLRSKHIKKKYLGV